MASLVLTVEHQCPNLADLDVLTEELSQGRSRICRLVWLNLCDGWLYLVVDLADVTFHGLQRHWGSGGNEASRLLDWATGAARQRSYPKRLDRQSSTPTLPWICRLRPNPVIR